MSAKMLATKLKNRVAKLDPAIVPTVHNVSINGVKVGCSGFFAHPGTGRIVYATTDIQCTGRPNDYSAYARYASSDKDYQGGRNRLTREEDLPALIVQMLTTEPDARVDVRPVA